MNSGSFVIKKITQLLIKLNYYFEYSFLYKMLAAVGKAASTSKFVGIFTAPHKNYWEGSVLLRLGVAITTFFAGLIKKLFKLAAKANGSSLNKSIFDNAIQPLRFFENTYSALALMFGGVCLGVALSGIPTTAAIILVIMAVALMGSGFFFPEIMATALKTCVPARLVKWYFSENDGIDQNTNYGGAVELKFKIKFLVIGIVFAIAAVVMPLVGLLIIPAVAALGFVIFTFYRPKLSYMLFFLGMLIIPSGYWNNMLILLSSIFYAGIYAVNWCMDKNKGLDLKYLAPSLVLFVFFAVLSLFTGFGGMDSVRVFAIFFGCIVHSVLVLHYIEDLEDLRTFIFVLSIALALTSLFGLYQYAMGIEIKAEFTDLTQSQGLSRLFSTMGNSNNDAECWVMILPFIIAMVVTTKSDFKRIILAGIAGICVIALMLTGSRSGYLALLGAAGIFVLMAAPRLVPIGILAFIILIPFLPESIIARVMTIGKDTSSKYRLYIWEGVLRMLKDFRIQGIGMGPTAFITIYRGYANTNAGPAMHSHNVFLSTMVEMGIGGFISFLAYLFSVFKAGIHVHIKSKNKEFKMYTAAAVASLTAFCIFGLVEYVWFYPRVMLVFWLVTGLVMALAKIGGKEECSL
ncbi:O-antigen ligase family protein [Tyzzerella sp. OttesenSCG-928-J15]|nr:O-antigen ligase family protein [Tyzzerella sp. OttesenSCG-928-J15]